MKLDFKDLKKIINVIEDYANLEDFSIVSYNGWDYKIMRKGSIIYEWGRDLEEIEYIIVDLRIVLNHLKSKEIVLL